MKSKISLLTTIIIAVVVGIAAFYGGMQYQKGQRGNFVGQFVNRNGGAGGFQGRQGNNRPVSGEIISQDNNSITVKLRDGSSKIVIFSDKTTINKASAGSKSDLKVGEKVAVLGTGNPDGSVTAQNVQLNPIFRGFTESTPSGSPR